MIPGKMLKGMGGAMDLAVLDVTQGGLLLREVAPGTTAETVRDRTEAPIAAGPLIGIIGT